MTIPKSGLTFVNKALPDMPIMTFVAFEAVIWIMENVEGVTSEAMALKILRNMQEKRYICHASGHPGQIFVNGFYFFSLNPNPSANPNIGSIYNGNLEIFKNDWVEVEFMPKSEDSEENQKIPEFLHATLSAFTTRQKLRESLASKSFYKSVILDVDQSGRSDRKEFGHLKYQRCYDPSEAYELLIQWSVGTGALISDLLHTWARKVQGQGMYSKPSHMEYYNLEYRISQKTKISYFSCIFHDIKYF